MYDTRCGLHVEEGRTYDFGAPAFKHIQAVRVDAGKCDYLGEALDKHADYRKWNPADRLLNGPAVDDDTNRDHSSHSHK